jgi:predicted MFS family arabinose efflux permease
MIAAIGVLIGVVIVVGLKPVDAHLAVRNDRNAFMHLLKTLTRPNYLRGFAATVLLATGGFMMMPFGTTFTVNNLGIEARRLPLIYLITGCALFIAGPLVGRLSDAVGKYKVFVMGTALSIVMVIITCNLGITPLWLVILVNAILFVGVTARMVSTSALISAVPDTGDRGAYMSVNSSIQQLSGGLAAALAGIIVVQTPSGHLERYPLLGYVVVAAMVVTVILMYSIHRMVLDKVGAARASAT